jgi:hypothetical protein
MIGQSKRLREPLSRRQRRLLAVLGASLVAAILALVAYGALAGESQVASGNGCVSVVIPGPTGGAELRKCGAAAETWCRAEAQRHGLVAQLVTPQCRLAGYRFGRL